MGQVIGTEPQAGVTHTIAALFVKCEIIFRRDFVMEINTQCVQSWHIPLSRVLDPSFKNLFSCMAFRTRILCSKNVKNSMHPAASFWLTLQLGYSHDRSFLWITMRLGSEEPLPETLTVSTLQSFIGLWIPLLDPAPVMLLYQFSYSLFQNIFASPLILKF